MPPTIFIRTWRSRVRAYEPAVVDLMKSPKNPAKRQRQSLSSTGIRFRLRWPSTRPYFWRLPPGASGAIFRSLPFFPFRARTSATPRPQQIKFIISGGGNDGATNPKRIMASNSLCMTAKPEYETWLMEGSLVPDRHFVLFCEDSADLQEKIDHFPCHTREEMKILAKEHPQSFSIAIPRSLSPRTSPKSISTSPFAMDERTQSERISRFFSGPCGFPVRSHRQKKFWIFPPFFL